MTIINGTQPENWRHLFLAGDKPTDRSIHDALILLHHHPNIHKLLRYNTFTHQAVAWASLPWHPRGLSFPRPLDDADGTMATGWIESEGLNKVSVSAIKDCLVTVAKMEPFNPLVDWLQSLAWDGQERIGKWLTYYLGAEPNDYLAAIGPKFLISAVARALRPGCKADCMLILEGPQGRLKSSSVRVLFGPDWYSDELHDLGSKDSAMQMQGKWCLEMAELSSISRSEANKIKAVLSRQIDRFRAPYERFVNEHPRQCVFVGTHNPIDGYFKDPTGSRRFWPVKCGTIDLDALAHDRDQLWAEAVHCWERGDRWWLNQTETALAQIEQDDRRETDPWEPVILTRLQGISLISVNEILREWLGISTEKLTKIDQMRVAAILKSAGYDRITRKINGIAEKVWVTTSYHLFS